jgi:hypothetical protein
VLNLGKAGQTLREAYDKGVVKRALTSGASYVTMGYGVDDSVHLEVSEFSNLLDRMLYEAETAGVTRILLTGIWMPYPTHHTVDHWDEVLRPFNQAIRTAARERGARLIDVAARMQRQVESGRVDPVRDSPEHLLVTGSRLIAHMVLQALRAEGAIGTRPNEGRRSLIPLGRMA